MVVHIVDDVFAVFKILDEHCHAFIRQFLMAWGQNSRFKVDNFLWIIAINDIIRIGVPYGFTGKRFYAVFLGEKDAADVRKLAAGVFSSENKQKGTVPPSA